MKLTSAEAAKLLRRLNDERDSLVLLENRSATFVAAIQEDLESVRPAYDYEQTQKDIAAKNEQIRKVKHAINVFNTTTEVEGTGMTIDEVLVYLSQLTAARSRYDQMRARLPKERINNFGRGSQIIEYTYANYDVEKAAEDYSRISDEQAKLQTALDVTNNTKTMEIVL